LSETTACRMGLRFLKPKPNPFVNSRFAFQGPQETSASEAALHATKAHLPVVACRTILSIFRSVYSQSRSPAGREMGKPRG